MLQAQSGEGKREKGRESQGNVIVKWSLATLVQIIQVPPTPGRILWEVLSAGAGK